MRPGPAEIVWVKRAASYGWGITSGRTEVAGIAFITSLFPREGTYLMPLSDRGRRAAGITLGELVAVKIGGIIREPGQRKASDCRRRAGSEASLHHRHGRGRCKGRFGKGRVATGPAPEASPQSMRGLQRLRDGILQGEPLLP